MLKFMADVIAGIFNARRLYDLPGAPLVNIEQSDDETDREFIIDMFAIAVCQ